MASIKISKDIGPLAAAVFFILFGLSTLGVLSFSAKAISALESYAWPGNVRELENRIHRAVIMAEGGKVTPEALQLTSPYAAYEGRGLAEAREALERDLVERTLTKNSGNLSRAAAELKISRPTLYELIEKLGIQRR